MAASDGLPSEIAPYLNYGVLGLVVLGLIFGWLWAKPAVERLLAERDQQIERLAAERDRLIAEKSKAEEQRDVAIAIAQDKLVPLLVEFTSVMQTLIPLLQRIVREGGDDRRR